MSDALFVTSRMLALDDLTYTISVYCRNDRFFAFWECDQCPVYDSPTPLASDRDEVIRACEQRIKEHHAACHTLAIKSQTMARSNAMPPAAMG